jgi:hypothetical protein
MNRAPLSIGDIHSPSLAILGKSALRTPVGVLPFLFRELLSKSLFGFCLRDHISQFFFWLEKLWAQ